MVLCLIVFGCQYQCNWLPGKTCLRNDLLCVEWDVKPYTLTHSPLSRIMQRSSAASVLKCCWNLSDSLLIWGRHPASIASMSPCYVKYLSEWWSVFVWSYVASTFVGLIKSEPRPRFTALRSTWLTLRTTMRAWRNISMSTGEESISLLMTRLSSTTLNASMYSYHIHQRITLQ